MSKNRALRQKPEAKWKRFEKLAAKIQQDMAPTAKVTHNEMILGRITGVQRQIDVSVRQIVGQYHILVVLECKDYAVPVDVKDVEEFIGLVDDVGANKGAMVAANGFTPAAKTRARNAGIDVYRLIDAENHDWHTELAIPMVCDFRSFGYGNFKVGGSLKILQELQRRDPANIALYDSDKNYIGTQRSLLWAMWNRREISEEPGVKIIHLEPNPMFARSDDGSFVLVEMIGRFEVLRKLYFGGLPLTKVAGFFDEAQGKLVMPGNSEIITDVLDTTEVERTWQQIPSLGALAVKPVLTLTAFDYYPDEIPVNPDQEQPSGA